jgi:hypothetical protein
MNSVKPGTLSPKTTNSSPKELNNTQNNIERLRFQGDLSGSSILNP